LPLKREPRVVVPNDAVIVHMSGPRTEPISLRIRKLDRKGVAVRFPVREREVHKKVQVAERISRIVAHVDVQVVHPGSITHFPQELCCLG
jgi:hypothetical protein